VEKFIIKQYPCNANPSIEGNGFNPIPLGDNNDDAEEFIGFVNDLIDTINILDGGRGEILKAFDERVAKRSSDKSAPFCNKVLELMWKSHPLSVICGNFNDFLSVKIKPHKKSEFESWANDVEKLADSDLCKMSFDGSSDKKTVCLEDYIDEEGINISFTTRVIRGKEFKIETSSFEGRKFWEILTPIEPDQNNSFLERLKENVLPCFGDKELVGRANCAFCVLKNICLEESTKWK